MQRAVLVSLPQHGEGLLVPDNGLSFDDSEIREYVFSVHHAFLRKDIQQYGLHVEHDAVIAGEVEGAPVLFVVAPERPQVLPGHTDMAASIVAFMREGFGELSVPGPMYVQGITLAMNRCDLVSLNDRYAMVLMSDIKDSMPRPE